MHGPMLAVRAVAGSVAHSVSGALPKSMLERCWWRGSSWWHHRRYKHQGPEQGWRVTPKHHRHEQIRSGQSVDVEIRRNRGPPVQTSDNRTCRVHRCCWLYDISVALLCDRCSYSFPSMHWLMCLRWAFETKQLLHSCADQLVVTPCMQLFVSMCANVCACLLRTVSFADVHCLM